MRFLVAFCIIILQACITQEKCHQKFPPIVETVTKFDTAFSFIPVPGASITDTITLSQIRNVPVDRIIRVVDSTGRTNLLWYKDAYGQLVVECQAREDSVRAECVSKTTTIKEDHFVSKTNGWLKFIGGLCVGIVVCAFLIVFRNGARRN